jgi:hypothetical protein
MKRNKEQINAKSGFADPDRIKEQREIDKPVDGKKSPWDFRAPQYDQRHSNFINAGTHYGIGINQPVGHHGDPKSEGVPVGRINTMRIDEKG